MCRFKLKQNDATTFMHFNYIIKWLNPRETFLPPPFIKMYMVKVYSKFVCIIPGVGHTLTIYIFWWRGGGSKNPHLGRNYPFKLVPVLILMENLVINFKWQVLKCNFYLMRGNTPPSPPPTYFKVSIYPWPGRDIGSIGRMFRNSPVLPTKQSGVILLISHHTLK